MWFSRSKKCIEPPRPRETARRFAEKFRHAGIGARAARQRVRMIAISRDDVVVRPRGRDSSNDDRFLSNIEMAKAADFLRLILLTRAFLETPDQQHQREHLDFVALLRRRHGRISRARDAVCRGGNVRAAPKFMQRTKIAVKKRSLTSELRKNIHVGVAPYSGSPTVSA